MFMMRQMVFLLYLGTNVFGDKIGNFTVLINTSNRTKREPPTGFAPPSLNAPITQPFFQPQKTTYVAPNPNYGTPNPTYGVPNTNYGAPNTNYGAPNTNYGAPNTNYGAPNTNYGAPNTNYGAPNTNYGAPNTNYGVPNTNYGTPNTNYGAPNTNYGAPNPTYGPPKPQYGAPPVYGPPKPQYGPPRPQYGPPRPQYGVPQNQYGPPQTQYGVPQNQYGPPQTQYGVPQNQYGPPQTQYGIPKTQYGTPQLYGQQRPFYGALRPVYKQPTLYGFNRPYYDQVPVLSSYRSYYYEPPSTGYGTSTYGYRSIYPRTVPPRPLYSPPLPRPNLYNQRYTELDANFNSPQTGFTPPSQSSEEYRDVSFEDPRPPVRFGDVSQPSQPAAFTGPPNVGPYSGEKQYEAYPNYDQDEETNVNLYGPSSYNTPGAVTSYGTPVNYPIRYQNDDVQSAFSNVNVKFAANPNVTVPINIKNKKSGKV